MIIGQIISQHYTSETFTNFTRWAERVWRQDTTYVE